MSQKKIRSTQERVRSACFLLEGKYSGLAHFVHSPLLTIDNNNNHIKTYNYHTCNISNNLSFIISSEIFVTFLY